VGIIGRNGAGKSTLLKILSRITDPSEGRVRIRGRVSSLLEVGTGFHPELTGRENIYLNGAVLGMDRAEIRSKFDEIVAFAEVEKFLDTPVKRFSSGMYVRLAFAVAAHLEPEILIVDEVLAVGDASFQKKCLGKMESVGREGRTVLFVSHNMAAITRLCERAILLDQGRVLADDASHRVTTAYLRSGKGTTGMRDWEDTRLAPGNDVVRLHSVSVRTATGDVTDAIDIRSPVTLEVVFDVFQDGFALYPALQLFTSDGTCAFTSIDSDPDWFQRRRPTGRCVSRVNIPGNILAEGSHLVTVGIASHDPYRVHLQEADVVAFHVTDPIEGDSARGDYAGPMLGVLRPLLPWTNQYISTRDMEPDPDSLSGAVGISHV
jgi:lipopolysaccharide transport system ATP-binding protein